MWKKMASLLIVLSVGLNVAFVGVWAVRTIGCRRPTGHADDHGKVWCPLHRRLNVTDEQWQRIEPHLTAFRRDSQSRRREIGRLRGEMIDLIAADEPDRQAIATKQEEIRAGRHQMQQLVITHLLAEKEVLTVEQEKELFDLLRRRSTCPGPGRLMGLSGTTEHHDSNDDHGRRRPNPAPNQE